MNYEIKPELEKILAKLKRKDPASFRAVLAKIREIVDSQNPDHYKSLQYSMKNKKRVHVIRPYVLVFKIDHKLDMISFLDYDHHDKIYLKHKED